MKREIKFRAWNTITESYYYNVQDAHDANIGDSLGGILNNDELVVEQYTGLHDKNGKPIYEGAIVHCDNDYEGTDYTGEVMFFNGGFCIWTGGFRNYVWEDMIPEIIGNIHENAELLEEDE